MGLSGKSPRYKLAPGRRATRSWLSFVTFLVARLITRMRRPRPTALGNVPRDFPTRRGKAPCSSSHPHSPPAPEPWGLIRVTGRGARGPLRCAPRSPARTSTVSCTWHFRYQAVTK